MPCGIFEDKARVKGMMGARPTHPPAPHPTHPTCLPVGAEDATTIRKAMVQTSSLSATVAAGDPQGLNQATRWINTKEDHANKILNTTADYFLAQRERDAAPPPPSPAFPGLPMLRLRRLGASRPCLGWCRRAGGRQRRARLR